MTEKVTIGNCELWHGDCREILPALAACAIVSDPPYGIAFQHGGHLGKAYAQPRLFEDAKPAVQVQVEML